MTYDIELSYSEELRSALGFTRHWSCTSKRNCVALQTAKCNEITKCPL